MLAVLRVQPTCRSSNGGHDRTRLAAIIVQRRRQGFRSEPRSEHSGIAEHVRNAGAPESRAVWTNARVPEPAV